MKRETRNGQNKNSKEGKGERKVYWEKKLP